MSEVRVEVRTHASAGGDGRLLNGQGGGIDHLPDQWATFVKDIRRRRGEGATVTMTSGGADGWTLSADGEVHIRYMLLVGFPDGSNAAVSVAAVDDQSVTLDANHPLAGRISLSSWS